MQAKSENRRGESNEVGTESRAHKKNDNKKMRICLKKQKASAKKQNTNQHLEARFR